MSKRTGPDQAGLGPRRHGTGRSRSERKAGRQRAEHARQHGLPVAAPLSRPAVAGELYGPEDDSEADRPSAIGSRAAKRKGGPPVLVWVVGGALAILVAVYVLSRLRAP